MPAQLDRENAWTQFWQSGQLHSLPGSLDDQFSGEVAHFWHTFFQSLQPTDRVLDIGTGNGALPRLALTALAGQCPQFDAIDLSRIAPPWHTPDIEPMHRRIRFHPETRCESLPFPAGSLTAAISQFAIEYSQLGTSIPALLSCLAPTASIAMILHHRQSRLCLVAEEELLQQQRLLGQEQIFQLARDLLPFFWQACNGAAAQIKSNPAAEQARHAFNEAAAALRKLHGETPQAGSIPAALNAVATIIQGMARRHYSLEKAAVMLDEHCQAHALAMLRNQELIDCAMSTSNFNTFTRYFTDAGFTVTNQQTLHHNGHLLGWQFTACRTH